MRPKVGHIKFLNCFPLYYGLVRNMSVLDMELIPGTPAELNKSMIEGKLDISPVSSIEYFRNKEDFLLFPDLIVGSSGIVRSILLISRVPVSELDGELIALTNTSSTSHILLRIILKYRYNIRAEYFTCPPNLNFMLRKAKAALLIGDKALEESLNVNEYYRYDLGDEWHKLCGKKMVYALWCVRKRFASEKPEVVKKVFKSLRESSHYSQKNLGEIIDRASSWKKFAPDFIESYLKELDYTFDGDAKEGVKIFARLANESGWLKQNGKLEFFK